MLGRSNNDHFERGDFYSVKKEDGDMQRLRTFPKNQSWLVALAFEGCCEVCVSPGWACKVSSLSYGLITAMLIMVLEGS